MISLLLISTISFLCFILLRDCVIKSVVEYISLRIKLLNIKNSSSKSIDASVDILEDDRSGLLQGRLTLYFSNKLIRAGIRLKVNELVKLLLMGTVLSIVLFMVWKKLIIIPLTILCELIVFEFLLKVAISKRQKKFNDQLGETLLVLSNSLRSGFTFEQSLVSISKDLSQPIGSEMMSIMRRVDLGDKIEDAMEEVAMRMDSEEMHLINTAVSIQRKVGGNLADILDNIGNSIRERLILKRNVKTLTAQGDISGKVIAALPIVVLVMISFVNPQYMKPLFTTNFGYVLLSIALTMELLGYFLIKKMINIEM